MPERVINGKKYTGVSEAALDAAERGMSAVGQEVAFQVTARGPVRIGTVIDWSMSGSDGPEPLVHYGISLGGRFYTRSETAAAL